MACSQWAAASVSRSRPSIVARRREQPLAGRKKRRHRGCGDALARRFSLRFGLPIKAVFTPSGRSSPLKNPARSEIAWLIHLRGRLARRRNEPQPSLRGVESTKRAAVFTDRSPAGLFNGLVGDGVKVSRPRPNPRAGLDRTTPNRFSRGVAEDAEQGKGIQRQHTRLRPLSANTAAPRENGFGLSGCAHAFVQQFGWRFLGVKNVCAKSRTLACGKHVTSHTRSKPVGCSARPRHTPGWRLRKPGRSGRACFGPRR